MKKVISFALIAVMCLSFFTSCSGKDNTYDVKNFADIQVSGLNGRGKIQVDTDDEKIELVFTQISSTLKPQQSIDILGALQVIKFQIASDNTENLSNGDTVNIKAIYNEEAVKTAKIKLTNTDFSYTISGLKDGISVDPFAEIELVYNGISPEVNVEAINRSEKQFVRDIRYSVEPNRKLRIGDKIVVTVETSEKSAEEKGYILPETLTKEFTVEGVDEYMQKFEDIDETTKEKMKKESSDLLESMCIDNYSHVRRSLDLSNYDSDTYKDTVYDKPELVNIYFNRLKSGTNNNFGAAARNSIFYVYKITAHPVGETDPRIVYAVVNFNNAIKHADGISEIDMNKREFFTSDKDIKIVYSKAVTANKGTYETQEVTP